MIHRLNANSIFKCLMWIVLVLIGVTTIKTLNDRYSSMLQFHRCDNMDKNLTKPVLDHEHPRNASIIFIGGHQSTGTGLTRILLDVHPMVRCGPEPIITWEVMNFRKSVGPYRNKLVASGVDSHVIDEATAAFIVSVIENMGPPAKRLCHKQPGIYYHLHDLGDLFPQAKFIHMIRDGRAAVLSTVARKIDSQFSGDNPVSAIKLWHNITKQMIDDCNYIGKKRCLTVRYECLVLYPELQLRRILKFLDLPWDPVLLKHENVVHNISKLNFQEASTSQFIKPIHIESLNSWTKNSSIFPQIFLRKFHEYTNLLNETGYLTDHIPPNYKELCRTAHIHE
ncbi:unnamed protein product [Heterobilharzia americana]|nr:unnamed protein product [Heterobilharzia americana]